MKLFRLGGKKEKNVYLQSSYNLCVNVAATILLLSTFCEWFIICNTVSLIGNDTIEDSNILDIDDILNGDIRIPVEMMLEYYNFSSFPGGEQMLQKLKKIVSNKSTPNTTHNRFQTEAAATTHNNNLLWSNKTIPYKISSIFSEKTKKVFHKAMKMWEDKTCLRFVPAEQHHVDYVEFVKSDKSCSSSIGRQGGRQRINVVGWCETAGHVAHEVGHCIGFWHEQSRPDRDEYVTIMNSHIKKGGHKNFAKIVGNKVDYQGTTYDFGSIMHYPRFAFAKFPLCHFPACETIRLKSVVKYYNQGSPYIGQRISLSKQDIEQANRLYSCPHKGIRGSFSIKLIHGKFQHNYGSASNIYVKIIIAYSNGTESTHRSSHKKAANELVWNEMIVSGKLDLQFFRISTWKASSGNVEKITMSETFLAHPGTHHNLRNCENTNCGNHVLFEYFLIPDSKQSSVMQSGLVFVWHFLPVGCSHLIHY